MASDPAFWLVLLGAVPVFWGLPERLRCGWLAAVSIAYVGWLEPRGTVVLLLLALACQRLGPLAVGQGRGRWVARALIGALLLNLALPKYVPQLVGALSAGPGDRDLVVPLGLSYTTFRLIHYVVEVSRGRLVDRSPGAFLEWIFLFPIFGAGPIERYDHHLAGRSSRLERSHLVEGLTRLAHGVIKKVLLADLLVREVVGPGAVRHALRHLDAQSAGELWWLLAWTFLYAYLDFAAYSDIAIGASRLFGLRVAENFDWPILARNLGDFWQRWHMTLARWCQAYVSLPMLARTRNPYLAAYASFVVMGLWHAGALHWVCWGLWHASGIAVLQTWSRVVRARRWTWPGAWPARLVARALTLAFVIAGYAFTAVHGLGTVTDSGRILLRLLLLG